MPPKARRSILNKKKLCGQCNLEVEEQDEFIECDKCNKNFHIVCTTLDKRQYDYLLKHESEEYVCHKCDDKSGTLKNELSEIKAELKNNSNQLNQLAETMNFMAKQYDEILKGVAENKKKLEIVQKENKILKCEVKDLKQSIKFLNDQRVKHDCIVRGVEAENELSAVKTVLKLSSDVGVDLEPESIEDAYFINARNKSNEKKTVVVKFNSKKSKEKLMSLKPKLKQNEATKSVFVNDYLSRETLRLFNFAKTLKAVGYCSVYVAGGRIFCKKGELSKPKFIGCDDDVDQLLMEATTNRPRNRRSLNAAAEDEVYLST